MRRFLSEGLISDSADLYTLTDRRGSQSSRASARSPRATWSSRSRLPRSSRSSGCSTASGSRASGTSNARNLARHLRSMDELLEATEDQLVEVEGIGPIMARTIEETLAEDRTRELVERFREYGLRMEEEGPAAPVDGPLVGKTLVLTGTLPNLTREDATERWRRRAARSPARCRRRPTTWWPARTRLEADEGAGARHGDPRRGRPAGAARLTPSSVFRLSRFGHQPGVYVLELACFRAQPQHAAALTQRGGPLVRALRARFPGLRKLQLARLSDGRWLQLGFWDNREHAQAAADEMFEPARDVRLARPGGRVRGSRLAEPRQRLQHQVLEPAGAGGIHAVHQDRVA